MLGSFRLTGSTGLTKMAKGEERGDRLEEVSEPSLRKEASSPQQCLPFFALSWPTGSILKNIISFQPRKLLNKNRRPKKKTHSSE